MPSDATAGLRKSGFDETHRLNIQGSAEIESSESCFCISQSFLLLAVTTLESSIHRCILNAVPPLCPRAIGQLCRANPLGLPQVASWDVKQGERLMSSIPKLEAETEEPKESPLITVFSKMQTDKCEFFLSSQLCPTVKVLDDGFQQEWPADSQRIQDLVISMFYEETGDRITTAARDLLMALLREECRKGGRRYTEAESQETDSDVIVQAVLYHVNKNGSFTGRTVDLVKALREAQKSGQFSEAESIPVFTNIFSRRLRRLVPVLRGYGVAVTMEHKEEGSHCSLEKLDSFQKEPLADDIQAEASASSSDVTVRKGKDLPPTDDSDGENRVDPPISRTQNPAREGSTVTETCQEAQVTSDLKGGAK